MELFNNLESPIYFLKSAFTLLRIEVKYRERVAKILQSSNTHKYTQKPDECFYRG